jgi:hypothetical protein
MAASCAFGQAAPPAAPQQAPELKGMPPRSAPGDYQAQMPAGTVNIGAEFKGHSVPTADGGALSTEDFVVVEVGLFGPAGATLKVSAEDFSLRINGKKSPYPAVQYGMVFRSLKDPEWQPPEKQEKSKGGGLSTGGDQGDSGPKVPPKPPIELQRAWAQRTQKSALPEGDRALPVAGLLFFQFRGKEKNIDSLEFSYAGPAGKATVALQP